MRMRHAEETPSYSPSFQWGWCVFLLAVFYFATPYQLFKSVGLQEGGVVEQIEKGVLTGGNLLRSVALIVLGITGVFALLSGQRSPLVIQRGTLSICILVFLSYAFFSISWAQDKLLVVKKLLVLAMFSVAALALATRIRFPELVRLIFLVSGTTLLLGLACEIALNGFHPFDLRYRFGGVLYPAEQAWNCILFLLSSAAMLYIQPQRRVFYSLAFMIALVFLVLTRSRAPVASSLFAVMVMFYLHLPKSKHAPVALLSIAILIFGLSLTYLLVGETFPDYLQNAILLGRDTTHAGSLTGRIPLWSACIAYLIESPVYGYGYHGFWTPQHVIAISQTSIWFLANSHNTYIEIALSLGVPGAILFVLIIFFGIRRSYRLFKATGATHYAFALALLLWLSLNMLFESLTMGVNLHKLVYMIVLAKLSFINIEVNTILGNARPSRIASQVLRKQKP